MADRYAAEHEPSVLHEFEQSGATYVAQLIHTEDSAHPSELETGLLCGSTLHVERFRNRPSSR